MVNRSSRKWRRRSASSSTLSLSISMFLPPSPSPLKFSFKNRRIFGSLSSLGFVSPGTGLKAMPPAGRTPRSR